MKQVFVPPADAQYAGYLRGVVASVGASVGFVRSPYVVALTDAGASAAPWVCNGGIDNLHSRLTHQNIAGVMPALSANADLTAFAGGPVFLKPADSMANRFFSPLCYTAYPDLDALAHALSGLSVDDRQRLVVQPYVGEAPTVYTVDAVVRDGQVVPATAYLSYDFRGVNDIGPIETAPVDAEAVATMQRMADAFGLVGGMHFAQFVQHDGWKLIDWNPRLPLGYDDGFWDVNGLLAESVKCLLGETYAMPEARYMQQRIYRRQHVPQNTVAAAKEMGFRVRTHHRSSKNLGLDAMVWTGGKQEADAKFAEFEALLN